ncbi:thiamine-phosphate kinase [Prosthecomicrobium pneumaticum]|uniref:Thiamine-monophosphate kinase n=1 Tax=Prosthecomicrobium pneumaticum TaxID=81895 RepID=A0A7W9L3P8_9HYPH|nr:thiamine-phosphate kinase [Prosthecomicrobium pneumaticum]MBB5754762.1 thiamine-monophosphate kinase [Prosthecomicrobium pneumaticum]
MAEKGARPGEFGLIERWFRPLATDAAAFGLIDDAAALTPPPGHDLVLTKDMVVAGVHFFADDPPAAIARKALRVNLSDLAAKGARPLGYLMGLALPGDWTADFLDGFAEGLAGDQAAFGIGLFGGDTVRASGGLTISITAIGAVPQGRTVRRRGARPGDLVTVSGTIGDAALGLRLRLGTLDGRPAGEAAADLLDRYLHPQPRTALADAVRDHATASLDVSDGLVGDLGHVCRASGVTARIEAAAVPLSPAAAALAAADESALASILTGGDDYEILATMPEADYPAYARAASAAGVPVTVIGRIEAGAAPPVVLDRSGRPIALPGSHDHF